MIFELLVKYRLNKLTKKILLGEKLSLKETEEATYLAALEKRYEGDK